MTSLFKKMLPAAAPAVLLLSSCAADEVKEVYQGEDIRFTTSVSRATETTLANLEEFKVYSEMDQGKPFINGVIAKKDTDPSKSSIFNLEGDRYYWPSGVNMLKFWAFAPTDVTASITSDSQIIRNFEPKAGTDNPGKDHKDLLVSYREVNKSDAPGSTVSLTFRHALSQISVSAVSGNRMSVSIKGAWIVNADGKGTLSFVNGKEDSDNNNMSWSARTTETAATTPATYGLTLNAPAPLSHSSTSLIGGADNSSLMLVPQKTSAYDFASSNNGAYILLLCRIEVEHDGAFHSGDGSTSDGPVKNVGEKHIHQVFPVSENYSEAQYGYTCVPIQIDWMPGQKYTYNLSFCTANSGAGVYPPADLPEGLPTENVVDTPVDKNPGDTVLEDPIKFNVEVEQWTEATESNGKEEVDMH